MIFFIPSLFNYYGHKITDGTWSLPVTYITIDKTDMVNPVMNGDGSMSPWRPRDRRSIGFWRPVASGTDIVGAKWHTALRHWNPIGTVCVAVRQCGLKWPFAEKNVRFVETRHTNYGNPPSLCGALG